jgi:hypothetical protein
MDFHIFSASKRLPFFGGGRPIFSFKKTVIPSSAIGHQGCRAQILAEKDGALAEMVIYIT